MGGNIMMTIPFTLIYHPMVTLCGWHAKYALYALHTIAFLIVAPNVFSRKIEIRFHGKSSMHLVLKSMVIICIINGMMIAFIDPKSVKQSGYHQALWYKQETETSFWGFFKRNKYVLMEDIEERRDYYNFECLDESERNGIRQYFRDHQDASIGNADSEGLQWYSLCPIGLSDEWTFNYYLISCYSLVLAFCTQCLSHKHRRKRKRH